MERLTENYLGCNQIKDCGSAMCGKTCKEVESCDNCPISKAIDKLAEYEQAEEDGLLIKLPCPIGTKVFCVMWGQSGLFVCEHEFEIRDLVEFGDVIFLTKAEAEQALAKMKGV